ncbi:MAG TPA: PAS domain S-box protein [Deltaproteobacteria bacterium]|nr:PAS domain S-box protein [Deltaproteobacteria bacterium]
MKDDLFIQCFNTSPIPGVITTAADGVIVEVNDAFVQMSGYRREDLVGRRTLETGLWVDPADRARVLAELGAKGKVQNLEVRFKTASGSEHDCILNGVSFTYSQVPCHLFMAVDITRRRRTQDALEKAEARYRALVENSLSGVAIFRAVKDGGDFEYVEFNRAAERIDSIKREDVVGKTLLEVFPGSRASGLYQALLRVYRTGVGEYLPVYFYKDQRISGWRESFVYRLPSGELVEVYSDQTALIRAQRDLSERNRALTSLIGNLPGMVYRCRHDRDWTMVAVSEGCLALTGYAVEDLVNNEKIAWGRVIVPKDRDRVWDEVNRALEKRENYELTYRIRTAGGDVRWVWDHGCGVFSPEGRLLFLEGFAFDITEHRRLQDKLRMTEERFARIFQASPDWVSITAMEDGAYRDVNEGYLKASGYTRDEIIGRTSLEIDIWERPSDRKRIVRKIKEQGSVRNEEVRFRTKSGELKHVLWSAVPITLDDEECILGWGRDITEYKLLEEELMRAYKMEAVGRLAGTIAHDFNNYLTAIDGFCELILLKADDKESVVRSVGKIREVKKSASSLIKQLLSFSRKQPARPVPVDLNEVVTSMKDLLTPVMGQKVDLSMELSGEPCVVLADRSQLEQTIMNLSLNARDAMPRGGRFTVKTAHETIDETSAGMHVDLEPGRYISLTVSDTGLGMDEETASHIFDPFFTTKSMGKGSGLGLTIVYNIVRQWGGCITLQSEPGKGSTFTIYLPAHAEAQRREARP